MAKYRSFRPCMVMRPFCGSTQPPVAMEVVLAAAQVSASFLVLKPRLVRLLPSGERYWTRQAWPLAVGYFLIDAMVFFSPWAAGSLIVPGFDCFGIPEGCAFVEAGNDRWSAAISVVVGPGVVGDAAVGGAVTGAPQYAACVGVYDGWLHRLNSLASSVITASVYISSQIGLGRV